MLSKMYVLTGSDEGKYFHIEDNKTYRIGRGPGNDIQIKDKNVSRYHLKIIKNHKKYLITDLMTKNGTFVEGRDIKRGSEVEVDEGVPIVIGMTVLGLGEICESCLKPFLASIGISRELTQNNNISKLIRINTIKKNLEFIYKTNNDLDTLNDEDEIYEKLIDNIFILLKRIDRCAVVLMDMDSGEIAKVVYRSRKPIDDSEKVYNQELVEHALQLHKTVMVSDSLNEVDVDQKITESLNLKNIRSAMCVPIRSFLHDRGVIYIDSLKRPYGFRRNDVALMEDIGQRIALAIDKIALSEALICN